MKALLGRLKRLEAAEACRQQAVVDRARETAAYAKAQELATLPARELFQRYRERLRQARPCVSDLPPVEELAKLPCDTLFRMYRELLRRR